MERNFRELLEERFSQGKFVCVGLDSDFEKIPEHILDIPENGSDLVRSLRFFNRSIVETTHDLVCAYKPNVAFYESYGEIGLKALRETVMMIHDIAPEVPVIVDAKVADIGNTNIGYVRKIFDHLEADAVTVHPYLGAEALEPFLERKEKGIFVLCRTSNPGAGEFQDLYAPGGKLPGDYMPLYQYVAKRVAENWNKNGNCGLVVGATYPEELQEVRKIVGDMPILIPGIGAQGGDLEKTVEAGKDSRGMGMIVNSSRGIIYASKGRDLAEASRRETQKLHDGIKTKLNFDYQKGFKDGLNGNPCKPISLEYVSGFEKGIQVSKIGK